jgi:hypothetical protein
MHSKATLFTPIHAYNKNNPNSSPTHAYNKNNPNSGPNH